MFTIVLESQVDMFEVFRAIHSVKFPKTRISFKLRFILPSNYIKISYSTNNVYQLPTKWNAFINVFPYVALLTTDSQKWDLTKAHNTNKN